MPRSRLFGLVARALRADRCERAPSRTRRRLLQAALAGGAAGVLPALPSFARGADARAPTVAIIGAGLAGLSAGHRLRQAGIHAQIFEASDRVGGRVWSSDAFAQGAVELGGEFINSDHADVLALATAFNLPLFNRAEDAARLGYPSTAYFFAGRRIDEAELASQLRALAQQIAADADLLERNFSRHAPRFDKLSVAQYLDRHAGLIPTEYVRTLLEASIRTEFGVEPAQSSALQLLFNLPTVTGDKVTPLGNSDEAFVIAGGNGRLVAALAQALPEQIRLRMPLVRLEARKRRGYRLSFAGGFVAHADAVILAVPPGPLRAIRLELALPASLRQAIADIHLGKNEKLLAAFGTRAWRQPQGFATEAWSDLGFSEAWDATQREAARDDGVLAFLLGGNEAVRDARSAEEQGADFVARLDAHVPGLAAAASGQFLRTRWTYNRWAQGAYTNFKPGQLTRFARQRWVEEDGAVTQAVRSGHLFFAGEQFSDEYFGFMNGAAQTGRLAAQALQAAFARGQAVA